LRFALSISFYPQIITDEIYQIALNECFKETDDLRIGCQLRTPKEKTTPAQGPAWFLIVLVVGHVVNLANTDPFPVKPLRDTAPTPPQFGIRRF
jgi:hypothetical protein